jgi:AraC-like DNA-binding protein
MLAIGAESEAGAPGGPLMIDSLANVLAVQLIRRLFGFRPATACGRGVLSRRKLATIIDDIMANLDNRPTLERMAELVHLSPDYFARQFKAATGLAPYPFVIARRVERAQELLSGRPEVTCRSSNRCWFLRPKPALFTFQKDRRRHTGTFSGVENRSKKERVLPIQGKAVPLLFSNMKNRFYLSQLTRSH